jgi:hypothetical protein
MWHGKYYLGGAHEIVGILCTIKMADCYVTRKPSFLQRSYNPDENSDHSCLTSAELISQLDETRKELSSPQLIIKLFYKEINDITTEKTPRSTAVNNIAEYEAGGGVASPIHGPE